MNEQPVSLGKTDVYVKPLGTGAWQWGDRAMWGFGQDYGTADIRAAFDASLAAGIDFFDTAEIYGFGLSERYLGQFLSASTQRAVIATKFFPVPWRWRQSSVAEALGRSLARLQLDHVDLYQIHWPLPGWSDRWVAGLADAVEVGLTRAVGVSNYDAKQTRRAHALLSQRGVPLATNQVEYSLLHRAPERNGLVETCRELGVTIIAYSPIAKGMLTGKYTPDNPPPGMRRRHYNRQYLARIQPVIQLLRTIGEAHGGKTPSQVALNWLICKGAVPIPGAKTARQVEENAGALGWRLTADQVAALDTATVE